MINTYNKNQLMRILGITSPIGFQKFLEVNDIPFINKTKHTLVVPKVAMAEWLIEQKLFRTFEEADAYLESLNLEQLVYKKKPRKPKQSKTDSPPRSDAKK